MNLPLWNFDSSCAAMVGATARIVLGRDAQNACRSQIDRIENGAKKGGVSNANVCSKFAAEVSFCSARWIGATRVIEILFERAPISVAPRLRDNR
jgi:hypothetical protein